MGGMAEGPEARPGVRSDGGGENGLLLREFAHRVLNELGVASAAVRLVERAEGTEREGVLAEAQARLGSLGHLLRLLARPVGDRVDLGAELREVCRTMRAARPDALACSLDLDIASIEVDGALARRVTLVAAELMGNAWKHALAGRAGTLRVSLRRHGRNIVLEVADDGAGGAAPSRSSGTGLGRGIVAELAAAGGGTVVVTAGPRGTVARLAMPLVPRMERDLAA